MLAVKIGLLYLLVVLSGALSVPIQTMAQDSQDVLESFEEQPQQETDTLATTRRKHQVLFVMGVFLLSGVFTTAGLGIAMAIYAKPVFVAHMISAGFTATLALIHAIVAIVWFFPF
jgi:phage-related tail protein